FARGARRRWPPGAPHPAPPPTAAPPRAEPTSAVSSNLPIWCARFGAAVRHQKASFLGEADEIRNVGRHGARPNTRLEAPDDPHILCLRTIAGRKPAGGFGVARTKKGER